MLGVFIAIVKLADIATVVPGPALFMMIAMLVCLVAAVSNFDQRLIWQLHPVKLSIQPVSLSPVISSQPKKRRKIVRVVVKS